MTTAEMVEALFVVSASAQACKEWLANNDPSTEVSKHLVAAQCQAAVMMDMMPKLMAGTPPESPALMQKVFVDCVRDAVIKHLPTDFDKLGEASIMASALTEKLDQINPVFKELFGGQSRFNLSPNKVKAIRWELFFNSLARIDMLRDTHGGFVISHDLLKVIIKLCCKFTAVHTLENLEKFHPIVVESGIALADNGGFQSAVNGWWDVVSKMCQFSWMGAGR